MPSRKKKIIITKKKNSEKKTVDKHTFDQIHFLFLNDMVLNNETMAKFQKHHFVWVSLSTRDDVVHETTSSLLHMLKYEYFLLNVLRPILNSTIDHNHLRLNATTCNRHEM